MWETSARLLKLLSLLQARRDWSGADLAAPGGHRAHRARDVGRLRDLGYPVHASPGTDGGYRLGAGAAMPPLLLDDDEAVAVAVGLRTAARSPVTGIEETSVRALAKLEQVLPSRLRRRVSALADYTVPACPTLPAPAVDPAVLTTLASACRDHERLRFATGPTTAPAPSVRSSRTASSPRAASGTWSAGTPNAATGARSGWTGSSRARRLVPASRPASCPRAATSRPTWHAGCPLRASGYRPGSPCTPRRRGRRPHQPGRRHRRSNR